MRFGLLIYAADVADYAITISRAFAIIFRLLLIFTPLPLPPPLPLSLFAISPADDAACRRHFSHY